MPWSLFCFILFTGQRSRYPSPHDRLTSGSSRLAKHKAGLLEHYREKESRLSYYDPDGLPDQCDDDREEWPFDEPEQPEFDVDEFEFEDSE